MLRGKLKRFNRWIECYHTRRSNQTPRPVGRGVSVKRVPVIRRSSAAAKVDIVEAIAVGVGQLGLTAVVTARAAASAGGGAIYRNRATAIGEVAAVAAGSIALDRGGVCACAAGRAAIGRAGLAAIAAERIAVVGGGVAAVTTVAAARVRAGRLSAVAAVTIDRVAIDIG